MIDVNEYETLDSPPVRIIKYHIQMTLLNILNLCLNYFININKYTNPPDIPVCLKM